MTPSIHYSFQYVCTDEETINFVHSIHNYFAGANLVVKSSLHIWTNQSPRLPWVKGSSKCLVLDHFRSLIELQINYQLLCFEINLACLVDVKCSMGCVINDCMSAARTVVNVQIWSADARRRFPHCRIQWRMIWVFQIENEVIIRIWMNLIAVIELK